MGTYDTPSGHPLSPPEEPPMPAEDVRVRVTEVLEDEGVPETLVEAIDKILESWATERDRRIDDSAGQAMYVQYLEEELHKLQQAKETP